MDDPLIPHLKTVHQFPHCFARIGVDRGAIRFVLAGAALMAPGLTSAGGRLPPDPHGGKEEGEGGGEGEGEKELREGDVAVVEAEGKEEACLVGRLRMGTEEIRGVGKGVVMDAGHFLGDGLWRVGID